MVMMTHLLYVSQEDWTNLKVENGNFMVFDF